MIDRGDLDYGEPWLPAARCHRLEGPGAEPTPNQGEGAEQHQHQQERAGQLRQTRHSAKKFHRPLRLHRMPGRSVIGAPAPGRRLRAHWLLRKSDSGHEIPDKLSDSPQGPFDGLLMAPRPAIWSGLTNH